MDDEQPPPRKRLRRRCKSTTMDSPTINGDDEYSAGASSTATSAPHNAREKLLRLFRDNKKVVVFTGSGISVSAGLSTFTGDLYVKVARKFKLKKGGGNDDGGSKVFCYKFLESHPNECFEFFKSLHKKACKALPTNTHYALCAMAEKGQLVRHYTLNFDGLASASGMSSWTTSNTNSDFASLPSSSYGKTVELHGNIHELVCRQCGAVYDAAQYTRAPAPPCQKNVDHNCDLRFRVLMYDDQEGQLINRGGGGGNPLVDLLPQDLSECHAVVWVGISFRQSASTQHFDIVYKALQQATNAGEGRLVPIFIVDPNPTDALEHLIDGLQVHIGESSGVYTIESTSDGIFGEFCNEQATSRKG